jgi:hypothetical protein
LNETLETTDRSQSTPDASPNPLKEATVVPPRSHAPTPGIQGQKNPPSRQEQLQIITHRWRTIELETKKNLKGRRLEDASSRHIEKK